MVARRLGVRQLTPSAEAIFGLDPVSAPTQGAALEQLVMPDRLAEYTPPDDAEVPAQDNDVHSDSIQLPNAIDQVIELLVNGTIQHTCDGVCDPD